MTLPLPTDSAPPAEVLTVENLTVAFRTDAGHVQALRGVSWTLREHEVLGIVGETGSGKSATALAVMGLLPPNAEVGGSVRFRGRKLLGSSEKDLAKVRGSSIAMVFQDPLSSLNPVYSVGYQVAEAIRAHDAGVSQEQAVERSINLLEAVGIANARGRIGDYPHEFSGGMRQRVVIAIAMANNPDVVLADEPTTALDVTIQAQVLDAIRTAREATGAAAVLITHDLGVVAGQADRVIVMYAGKVVEEGNAEDVFYRPRMPYTLGLLGSLPRLDAQAGDRLTPIAGSPPVLDRPMEGCSFAPRCPMAREQCFKQEPLLAAQEGEGHRAACHFSDELVGKSPLEVFPASVATVPTVLAEASALDRKDATGSGLVVASELVKHFPVRSAGVVHRTTGSIHAVCGVDIEVAAGKTLGLVGESGSGKSTVGQLLMSLQRPTSGSVMIDGAVARRPNGRVRPVIQIVFQDPMGSLNPRMTAADLIAEPLRTNGSTRREGRARAVDLLLAVGLSRAQADRYPHEFSGGQRQRIGIARALALRPRVLILDEPVSALDVSVQAGVLNLLADLQDTFGLSYLFISHDLSVVRHIADRVAVMYLGRIVETGDREQIFERPAHPYTHALISAVPVPDPIKERARPRKPLIGEMPSTVDPPSGCRFRTRCPKFRHELDEGSKQQCITLAPQLIARGQDHPVACHFPEQVALL